MSENTETNPTIETTRSEELRAKAKLLGIKHAANIGDEKLADKIGEHLLAQEEAGDFQNYAENTDSNRSTDSTVMAKIPLKVRVSNLDVEEREHSTVYRCVINKNFTIAHIIPLDTEWYVPKCLVDSLENAMMQVHVKEMDPLTNRPTGNMIPKQVKKYNVQYVG